LLFSFRLEGRLEVAIVVIMIDELAQAKFKVLYVLVFTAVEEEL
jgi:hypothetical protein